jgi:hypothetical protein
MKQIAIMQPAFAGWTGFFSMIDLSDEFLIYDTAQFSRQSWQQRNRVRGRDGNVIWLTVPVKKPHMLPLNETRIADSGWQHKHWRTITSAYSHTPGWNMLEHTLSPIYAQQWEHLAAFTTEIIRALAATLTITTPISLASSIPQRDGQIERLEDIIQHTHATHFLEPQGGTYLLPRTHISTAQIVWHNYTPAEYTQGSMPWQSHLSVIDLIAWHGDQSLNIIRQGYNPDP